MIKVYLAGKVAKGNEIGNIEDWRSRYFESLRLVAGDEIQLLDPEDASLDESDPMLIVGHDCSQIRDCDVVIVNAERKLGVGTAQEMIVAKYYKKCVVSLIPNSSHYCRKNLEMYGKNIETWIHPFMKTFSDFIVTDLTELNVMFPRIQELVMENNVKDISIIDSACNYYASMQ